MWCNVFICIWSRADDIVEIHCENGNIYNVSKNLFDTLHVCMPMTLTATVVNDNIVSKTVNL